MLAARVTEDHTAQEQQAVTKTPAGREVVTNWTLADVAGKRTVHEIEYQ